MSNQVKIRMPQLALIEGIWEGTYSYAAPDGRILDVHKSRLTHVFPDSAPDEYHQTNAYTWESGQTERIEFAFKLQGDELAFDQNRAKGRVWEEDIRIGDLPTIRVSWERTDHVGYTPYDLTDCCVHELIQIDRDATKRARVWQWFQEGELVQRTFIKEVRVD